MQIPTNDMSHVSEVHVRLSQEKEGKPHFHSLLPLPPFDNPTRRWHSWDAAAEESAFFFANGPTQVSECVCVRGG